MNLKFKKTFLLVIILFIAFPNFVAYAQNDTYTLLAPIPCVGVGGGSCDQNATQTRMPDYIKGLVRLVIGISTVFAVLMIVIGGFQYMTSDALQGKQDGKNRIKNSFLGLLLIGASFIILNTINPNLLEINLNIESVQTASQTVGTGELSGQDISGRPMTEQEIADSNRVKQLLQDEGIFTYAGPCEQGQTTGCVNLNGLPQSAIDGLITLNNACSGCSITITGGTEAGHKTHGVGKANVDLRSTDLALNTYIINNGGTPQEISGLGLKYIVKIGGRDVTFLRESNHWHVSF